MLSLLRTLSTRSSIASRAASSEGKVPQKILTTAPSREYPDSPRVGIGVVILRKLRAEAEVLLVRRAREPQKGYLSFPGGSLELGETMADCAVRESLEETGLRLRNTPSEGGLGLRSLSCPRPIDAVDSLHYDAEGRVQYHYTIVDLAAVPEDPTAEPTASDDADEVIWMPVDKLQSLQDLSDHCARIAEEAVVRFDISGSGS